MANKSNVTYPKLITNNKISESLSKTPLTLWITTSSKNGLIFTTNGNSSITTLLSSDIHSKSLNIKQKSTKLFNYDCNILRIQCSCTGEYLAIVLEKSNEYFVHIYDTKTFSFEYNSTPYPLCVEYVGQSKPLDFQWNPTIEGMFVYTTDGNRIYCLELNSESSGFSHKRIDELKSNGNCISWSPKGKQLVVGCMDGSMLQYKPELTLVRREPAPIIDNENELECVGICWLGTTDFVFAFEAKKSQNLNVSILVLKKNQPAHWTHLGNICKNVEKSVEPVRFYFENIFEWGLVVVASNNGICVGFLEKEDDVYKNIEPPEDKNIILELSEKCEMPSLCGMVIDKSPTEKFKEIIDGITIEYNLVPVIILFTSSGILQSYWLVVKNDKYKNINVSRESIIPCKIRNGKPQGKNITTMSPENQESKVSFDSKPFLMGNNTFSSPKTPSLISSIDTSSERLQPSIKKDFTLLNNSIENDVNIKIGAKEKEAEIKNQLQNKEKEIIKKVEEKVDLIAKLEKEREKESKEEELKELRKICGDLITEYYSKKNINMVKIRAQENAINKVNNQLSITNDESVKELLKTLKVMTISQNKVLYWAQIVSEDVETLKETLKVLKNKISYMKKNKASAAETYFFDTNSRFDESETKLQKVKENFTTLTNAVESLNKKIEVKGLMNNIVKLDNDSAIRSEDQEYIQQVSRNIVRATHVAFRKLKLLSDKYTELKNLKQRKDQNELNHPFINQSLTFDNTFILEKTYVDVTQTLFTAKRVKNRDFQNYLRKRCSQPTSKKFIKTLPFIKNTIINKDEEEKGFESSVLNVKDMLEKCLIVSRSVNNSFSENSCVDIYLTKNDITKIRQNTLNEAKKYAADFKTTLEMTRKLMAAEMPKIDFNPQKEEKNENKLEEKNTPLSKSIEKDILPVEKATKVNTVFNPEIIESKNEVIIQTPVKEEKLKPITEKKVETNDTPENKTDNSLVNTKDTEETSLGQTTTVKSPESSIFGQSNIDKNTSQSSSFGCTTPSKSIFGGETQTNQETPKSTVFSENSGNIQASKPSIFSDTTPKSSETSKSSFFEGMSGNKNNENSPTTIFGSTTKTPPQQGSFFGGSNVANTPIKQSVFGGSSVTQKPSVFGQSAFGGSKAPTSSVFGGSNPSGQSAFGGTQSSNQSVFGGSQQSGQSVFGGSQNKSVFGGSTFGGSFNNTATKPSHGDEGMDDGNNISSGFFNGMNGLGSQMSEKKSVFGQSAFGASCNTSKDNSAFSFAKPSQGNTFQQTTNLPKPGFFSNTGSSFGSTNNTVYAKSAFGGSSNGTFGTPSNTAAFGKSAFGQSSFSSFTNQTGASFSSLSNTTQPSTFGNSSMTNKSSSFTQWR